MQRRAAAVYAAFFLVLAAGAYGVLGFAQAPAVTVDDPDYTLGSGDTLTADGRTYTVGSVQPGTNEGNDLRSVDLTWVNESARYTASIENDSTVSPVVVQWPGQENRQGTVLTNGSTQTIDGTDYQVVVAAGDPPTEFALVAGETSETYAVGDTLAYQGETATVTDVSQTGATIIWGDPYRVTVEAVEDPTSMTFTQEINVTARLVADPAVEDQTVTRADGREYVVYVEDGSTEPLATYLPTPETETFEEGEQLTYEGREVTVAAVDPGSVTLAWTAPRENTLSLDEGARQTFDGTEYAAHFPDNSTLALTSDVDAYEAELAAVDTYHERMNGLWGITILGGLAAVFLIGAAYLPSRY